MKNIGDKITWETKGNPMTGTIRGIEARYIYVVNIDGSTKQMVIEEREIIKPNNHENE